MSLLECENDEYGIHKKCYNFRKYFIHTLFFKFHPLPTRNRHNNSNKKLTLLNYCLICIENQKACCREPTIQITINYNKKLSGHFVS